MKGLFEKTLLALAVAAVVWVALLYFVPYFEQERLFFFSARELQFFDFFNARAVAAMANPYVEAGRSAFVGEVKCIDQCYPALIVMFTGLFPESVFGSLVCLAVELVVFFAGVAVFLRRYSVPLIPSLAVLAVSAPFLFAAQVNNTIFLSVGAAMVFLAEYDSSVPWRRAVAAVALAVASVLKISPILLGLLYLLPGRGRIDWRSVFLSAGVFTVLLLVPFAFFGGVDGFIAWFKNAALNSKVYSYRNGFGVYGLFAEFLRSAGYDVEYQSYIHRPLRAFATVFALVLLARAFILRGDEFVRRCLVVLFLLLFPPTMMCYTSLYLVPLLMVGVRRSSGRRQSAFAACWFTACLPVMVPLAFGSLNAIFAAVALLWLSFELAFGKDEKKALPC